MHVGERAAAEADLDAVNATRPAIHLPQPARNQRRGGIRGQVDHTRGDVFRLELFQHGGRHQVIFAPRDEQKGHAGVVMVVDRDVLRAGDEIRQHAVPENAA